VNGGTGGDVAVCLVMYLSDGEKTREFSEALRAEGVEAGAIYDSGGARLAHICPLEDAHGKDDAVEKGVSLQLPAYTEREED